MSGISRLTALEIFTNPYDLQISIVPDETNKKYAIFIARGPSHNFKILLSSAHFTDKLEDAIAMVKGILEVIEESCRDVRICEPLTPEFITRILDRLREHQIAKTFEMSAVSV